ncbi:sulfotransferase 1B1-like [Musca vetustissima]|uniref:sulfotransferase 1B1-like n=1 Tax=Musca vetustissima TaxID=27455 RepID=UPI002AB77480|nr:sulfotransferase 1B1-like [Musca vetustissima]
MFTTQSRSSESAAKRQSGRNIIEVRAPTKHLPLPQEERPYRWCTLPLEDEDYLNKMLHFEVKEDDVYVVTFPKCGTTWIQEATWVLVHDLDYAAAKKEQLMRRSPYMEIKGFYGGFPFDTIEAAKHIPSPRVLKSHLPACLIPHEIWSKKAKVVYCARNPKDMAVSFYHFHRGLGTWEGTIDEFVDDLINGDIMYSPYWYHVWDFWQMRNEENVFFATYEDMKRDLRKVLIDLNKFLGKPDLSEEQLQQLQEHLSFKNMKENSSANPTELIVNSHASNKVKPDFEFMRRGIVGSYKDELSPETQAKLDEWIAEHLKEFNISLEEIFGQI